MPKKPKTTCCRSSPRCRRCPVVLKAEARAGARAAVVEEIFRGSSRPLPAAVEDALAALSLARTQPRRHAPAALRSS